MSYSFHGSLPPRRQATTAATTAHGDDAGLTQSLSQLSITNELHRPTAKSSRRASTASNTSLRPPPQRSSSATPQPRNPSRSPSDGPNSRRGSCAGTPPLLRKASINSLHSASGPASARSSLSRRASYGQLTSATSSKTPPEEEKPPVTANSIASDYFRAELETYHGPVATLPTDTIVILNDAVYGHRFSRPRTSRNALSTIVERPERIKASVLGVSTAYVRLGGRHCRGRVPIRPKANIFEVDSIPFRIHKTTRRLPLTSPAVTNVHGIKWMEELKLMCDSAESKLAMGGKELQRPDIPRRPDDPIPQQLHEGDLYLCAESLDAMEGALGAVCEAVDTVFGEGPQKAFVAVRPPGHHCSASHPSGFCWVNNVHVGIMHGALYHGLTHAAIIDFDLHHGDGSQAIAWEHNSRANAVKKNEAHWKKTSIGYFSLHDINSYPCEWGDLDKVRNASVCIDNAHGQSVWNVHLQSWKTEQDFWILYETKYSILLDKTRKYLGEQAQRARETGQPPKAAIFLSAGFDASEWEGAGMQRHKVNVPTEFYARLTEDVVSLAAEVGLAVDGRVISVLEGGYSDRALCSGILSHLSGMVGNIEPAVKAEQAPSGLGHEMGQRIGVLDTCVDPTSELTEPVSPMRPYNPSWWASGQLDQLEQPEEPASAPRRPSNSTPPTYSSPTQASTLRVTDPIKMRRSLSSLSTGQSRVFQRPASPPPPEVSWVVAAKELCNMLIPAHRQTDSYKAEELNAEASRARRDRQSILLGLPPPPPPPASSGGERPSSRMSLRERRPRAIGPIDEESSEVLTKTRRRPVTTTTPVASPMKANVTQSARRSSRRLSGASVVLSPTSEEPPMPPVPSTAPVPRRTTASRPSSRTGRVHSSDKLPVLKQRSAPAGKEARTKGSRAVDNAGTPARAGEQSVPVGADTPTPSTGRPLSVASQDSTADVDQLAAGVKKIRINLITQSQREAREKTKEDTASRSAVGQEGTDLEATIANPVGMSSMPMAPEELPAQPASCAGVSSPVGDFYPSDTSCPTPAAPSALAGSDGGGGSSPEVPRVAIHAASDTNGVFIAYQPEGTGTDSVATVPSESLTWLPPQDPTSMSMSMSMSTSASASTPSVHAPTDGTTQAAQPSGLFQYQHQSGIPFAPRPDKPFAEHVRP
ncbi:hypothetical protein E4U41_006590 [Claviceps citrina]|nr:hypothetical protein E4U41_006590 [Claviceps citrina]